MTLSTMTFSIMTVRKTALSLANIQHFTQYVKSKVIMLSVFIVLLCVVMPSVVAPSMYKLQLTGLNLVLYSQRFIFFITCKWAQQARVFVLAKPIQPSVM